MKGADCCNGIPAAVTMATGVGVKGTLLGSI
jgi:hypothetical protein